MFYIYFSSFLRPSACSRKVAPSRAAQYSARYYCMFYELCMFVFDFVFLFFFCDQFSDFNREVGVLCSSYLYRYRHMYFWWVGLWWIAAQGTRSCKSTVRWRLWEHNAPPYRLGRLGTLLYCEHEHKTGTLQSILCGCLRVTWSRFIELG